MDFWQKYERKNIENHHFNIFWGRNTCNLEKNEEGVAISLYGPRPKKDVEALLFSIVKMQANYIKRISHPEPGMKAKAYFKDLRENFSAQVGEISDQLNS